MSAGMNEIKNRLKSVGSTMQITKAMELVATSKLRRAKAKAEQSRVYYETLSESIDELSEIADLRDSKWSCGNGVGRTLFIVIAGDRGLAGGFNSSIFRMARELCEGEEAVYLPIGKKALDHYTHRECEIFLTYQENVDDVTVGDALSIAEKISEGYKSGEFGKVVLVYTRFASMISQVPTSETLLPLEIHATQKTAGDVIIGGDPEEMLDKIVPYYLGGVISTAVRESLASESAARRTAMNSANKNAEEMISSLMLKYNRARQAMITQEITEIISGSAEQ